MARKERNIQPQEGADPASERYALLNRRQRMQIRIRKIKRLNIFSAIEICVLMFLLFLATALPGREAADKSVEAISADAEEEAALTMDFVGDVMLGRYIKTVGEADGYDTLFSKVNPYWNQADLVFANLENAVLKTDTSDYDEQVKNIHLYCNYTALEAASEAGINVFGCANNHSFDYGPAAISELVEYFQNNGTYYAGIGNSISDAASWCLIEENGIKIAFISISDVFYAEAAATEGTAGLLTTSYGGYNQLVNMASKEADLTIVYFHWGEENEVVSNEEQAELGYQLIDAGADIIIGAHPHVLQDIELYKEGIIFYSLGNFIFDQGNTYSKDSVMVQYRMLEDGSGSFTLLPVRLDNGVPEVTDNTFYKNRINRELTKSLESSSWYYDEDGHVVIPMAVKELTASDESGEPEGSAEEETAEEQKTEMPEISAPEEIDGAGTEEISQGQETGAAALCFDACDERLYTEVYPAMQERGLTGMIILKNGRLPGDKQTISAVDFLNMIRDGWSYAITLEKEEGETDAEWKSRLGNYLENLRVRVSVQPSAYFVMEGSCSEAEAEILTEENFDLLLGYEEQAVSDRFAQLLLIPYQKDGWESMVASSNGHCGLQITINWNEETQTEKRYEQASFMELLESDGVDLQNVEDLLANENQ